MTESDEQAVTAQLGRRPRDVAAVAYRCRCGRPAVVATRPRLSDQTPFPTTYYLTCARAVAACSRLEASGVMAQLSRRLRDDAGMAAGYAAAHRAYLGDRAQLGHVPEIAEISAGGMPDRVKCLHALVAHALAAGPGVNPIGDEALQMIGTFWSSPCGSEGP